MFALWLVLSAGVPTPAAVTLEEAVLDWENGEAESARAKLVKLVNDPAQPPEKTVIALSYLAALYVEGGEDDAAKSALLRMHSLDPAHQLDPVRFPPKLLALDAQVRPSPVASEPPALAEPVALPRRRIPLKWLPGAVGGAALVTGVIFYGAAASSHARIRNRDGLATLAEAEREAEKGRSFQTVAFLLGGVGLAAIATTAVLYLFFDEPPAVAVGFSAQGASVAWGLSW